MHFLIAPFIALFIVVLSACVMGLGLLVTAVIFGSFPGKENRTRRTAPSAPPTPAAVVAILKWAAAALMPEED